MLGGFTEEIKTENGIAEMKKLSINDSEQWVVIRGENRINPILIHFHGGPGGSQTGNFRKYLSALEKDFVVINWDQRGTGKSFHPNIPLKTMNMAQLVEDAKDLVRQRGLITKYKGVSYKKSTQLIQLANIFCSELTLKEKMTFMKGFTFSFETLWAEWSSINLREKIKTVNVPVYFIAGRHDKVVPLDSTKQYFEILRAPKKELAIFEESAHLACFEEPNKFCELLKSIKGSV